MGRLRITHISETLIAIYGLFLLITPWFLEPVPVGLLSLVLVALTSVHWGVRGGMISSVCSTVVVFQATYMRELSMGRFAFSAVVFWLIALSLGSAVDRLRRREQELKASESKYRALVDQSMDMMYVHDLQGQILEVNQAAVTEMGYSRDELLAMNVFDLHAEKAGKEDILAQWSRWEVGDKAQTFEVVHQRRDHSTFQAEVTTGKVLFGSLEAILALVRDVTERKQVEEALRESEARFQLALEGSETGVWDWNMVTNQVRYSSQWKALLGYQDDDIEGTFAAWEALWHPDDETPVRKAIDDHLAGRSQTYEVVHRLRHKNGQWKWVMTRGEVHRDAKGDPVRWTGTDIDVTARIEANQEIERQSALLRRSEEELRQLVTQMQQGLAVHEVICDEQDNPIDYRFLNVNASYEKLTGLRGEDIIGKTVLEVLPQTEPYWIEQFGQVALTREPAQFENYSVEFDKYYRVSVYSPRPRQFAAIVEDVTDRTRTERALRESEERFRSYVQHAPYGVFVTNEKGAYQEVNPAACAMTGYREEELLAMSLTDLIPAEHQAEAVQHFSGLLDNGASAGTGRYLELPFLHKDGSTRVWSVNAIKLNDTAFLGFTEDITERKQAAEEIRFISFHDTLTGLYNRRFFEEELERLDTARNLPLSLVMLDVNGLKLANDAFGHETGDELLVKVAAILRDQCRNDDIIARIGGDEFVILLPKTKVDQANQLMARVSEAFAEDNVRGVPISASWGSAAKTDPEQIVSTVFKAAEDRMYRDKVSDRSSYRHESIQLILKTLYETAPREEQHAKRVSAMSERLGKAMGLGVQETNALNTAGLLHDIGKIAIKRDLLVAAASGSEEEWNEFKRHPEVGYSILSSFNDYAPLAEYVVAHHERWDGGGYPKGLQEDEIPCQARVIALADAYDAMVSARPFGRGMSHEDALEEIAVCAGFQFDPEITEVFLQMMAEDEG